MESEYFISLDVYGPQMLYVSSHRMNGELYMSVEHLFTSHGTLHFGRTQPFLGGWRGGGRETQAKNFHEPSNLAIFKRLCFLAINNHFDLKTILREIFKNIMHSPSDRKRLCLFKVSFHSINLGTTTKPYHSNSSNASNTTYWNRSAMDIFTTPTKIYGRKNVTALFQEYAKLM